MLDIKQQNKIQESGVRSIFTPGKPAVEDVQFSGRKEEISQALTSLLRGGEHILIYGDRGVGKTSLSEKISKQYSALNSAKILKFTCSSNTSYAQLITPILKEAAIDASTTEIKHTHNEGGVAKIKALFASAEIDSHRKKETTQDVRIEKITTTEIAGVLSDLSIIYVVDEFDIIKDSGVIIQFAELIKTLSDVGSSVKIALVGVADSSYDLVNGHESVTRCLKEIQVNRLSNENIADIVVSGAARVKIRFSNLATATIVYLSDGFPYFTHLISLQCCEYAIANNIGSVENPDVVRAISSVAKDARATFGKQFIDATRSYSTEIYGDLLLLAARYGHVEFSTPQIRNSVMTEKPGKYGEAAISKCLTKLVHDKILLRIKRGHYKFTDPRMAAYLRIEYKDLEIVASNKAMKL